MSTGIVLATWFSEHSRSPECADILNSPPEWVSLYPVIIMVVSSTGSTSAQTPAHARVISRKGELSGEGHLWGVGGGSAVDQIRKGLRGEVLLFVCLPSSLMVGASTISMPPWLPLPSVG